jgi:hypothetical protein
MENSPLHIPGAPERRIGHLRVGVAWTEAVWEAERDLEIRTLTAVPLDANVRLESLRVKCDCARPCGSSVSHLRGRGLEACGRYVSSPL